MYLINGALQILQAALTNSARILITSVSIYSFSLIAKHTFSVTLKSRDRAGQVLPKIYFVSIQLS